MVWNIADFGEALPTQFTALGPCEIQPRMTLPNQSLAKAPPARIGVAFIPPSTAGPLDWLAHGSEPRREPELRREPESRPAPRREPIIVAERVGASGSRLR